MKQTTLAKIKKGDLFYTLKEFEKHGDDERYLRIKDDYDAATRKWHCPKYLVDAIGNGRYFKPDTIVVII